MFLNKALKAKYNEIEEDKKVLLFDLYKENVELEGDHSIRKDNFIIYECIIMLYGVNDLLSNYDKTLE